MRSGLSYGVDYVLYRGHPEIVHAEFAAVVQRVPPLAAAGSGDAPEAMDDPPNEARWPPRGTGGRGRDPLVDARGFDGRGGTRRRTEKGFFSPRK